MLSVAGLSAQGSLAARGFCPIPYRIEEDNLWEGASIKRNQIHAAAIEIASAQAVTMI